MLDKDKKAICIVQARYQPNEHSLRKSKEQHHSSDDAPASWEVVGGPWDTEIWSSRGSNQQPCGSRRTLPIPCATPRPSNNITMIKKKTHAIQITIMIFLNIPFVTQRLELRISYRPSPHSRFLTFNRMIHSVACRLFITGYLLPLYPCSFACDVAGWRQQSSHPSPACEARHLPSL